MYLQSTPLCRRCAAGNCGHLRAGAVRGKPIEDRFWAYVDKRGPDECWLWLGACFNERYGAFGIAPGQTIGAHRFAYMLAHGADSIPDGIYVCHTCDVKQCVNEKHLFLGTTQDNTADRHAKQREERGEQRYNSKFTVEQIKDMRTRWASGESLGALGRAFGVTKQCISHIVHRRAWKHVE